MSLRRRGCRIVLGVVIVLLALTCLGVALSVILPEGGSKTEGSEGAATIPTSYPTRKPTPQIIVTAEGERIEVGGIAYMDGRDPDARPPCTFMHINVWDQAPRQKVVCTVVHGDRVRVVEALHSASEDRYYFKIDYSWSCKGWVSEPFLSTEFQNLLGDPIQ